jgi:TRAP-type C4-dicarboxylate transport system permease small subunit
MRVDPLVPRRRASVSALEKSVRALARIAIALAAAALLASLALIAASVVMRYVLNQPIAWVDELVGYLLVASVMLAAADALIEGEHIAVDIVTERLAARGRRVVLLIGFVSVALSALLLVVEGYDMVAFSMTVNLLSNGYLAVPMWIPQLVVPVGAALLFAAALVAFVAAWRDKRGPTAEPRKPVGVE